MSSQNVKMCDRKRKKRAGTRYTKRSGYCYPLTGLAIKNLTVYERRAGYGFKNRCEKICLDWSMCMQFNACISSFV